MNMEFALERLESELDPVSLTMLVCKDTTKRPFIGEAIATGAALFIVHRYMVGFLKGLGLDALAEKHGATALKLFNSLRANCLTNAQLAQDKLQIGKLLEDIKFGRIDSPVRGHQREVALRRAHHEVVLVMQEVGCLTVQAEAAAISASQVVLNELDER
jgi:hypothetical protein